MNQIELNVEARQSVGKGFARRARAANQIPGIFYGPHLKEPVGVSVPVADFSKARTKAGANTIFKLQGGNLAGKLALIKSVQLDPITDNPIHIDFYEVREGEKLKVKVPVALVGKALGTQEGGILEQLQRSILIHCLPKDIPSRIEADVSALNINESLHVSDIKLPEGVSVVGNVNYTLAAVGAPEKEEVAATAAAATPAAAVPATSQKNPEPAAAPAADAKKTEKK